MIVYAVKHSILDSDLAEVKAARKLAFSVYIRETAIRMQRICDLSMFESH